MQAETEPRPLPESFATNPHLQSAINLLEHSNPDVHRNAADITFRILTTEFEPAALIHALTIENWKLRANLVKAIEEHASNLREQPTLEVQASTQLREIIATEKPPSKTAARHYRFARNGALLALWQIAEEDALPDLFEALGDPEEPLRNQASEIVRETTYSTIESRLMTLIQSGDGDFLRRAEATIVLGKRGNPESTPYLLPLLGSRTGGSNYSEIGYRARETLANLGPLALPNLLQLISAPETVLPNEPRRVHTFARKDALWTVEHIFEDLTQVEEGMPYRNETLEVLTSTLSDDVRGVAKKATSTLARVIWKTSSTQEEKISETVSAIRKLRYADDARHLLWRLERLEFPTLYALPPLMELSKDQTLAPDLRMEVLSAIEGIKAKQ